MSVLSHRGAHSPTVAQLNTIDLLAAGPTRIEAILDAEVRRVRAQPAADHGEHSVLPPVDAPISDDEREAAYARLMALAADPADPPPAAHR